MTDYKTVSVYTDGSCPNNPSEIGGVGIFNQTAGTALGYRVEDKDMTNNRAEMLAVIMAIMSEDAESLEIFTDSEYISKNLTENVQKWRKNGYNGIKNRDLWEILYDLTYGAANVRFVYVTFIRRSSHAGNVVADALATAASGNINNAKWDYKKDLKAWINKEPEKRHKVKAKLPKQEAKPKQSGAKGAFLPF